MRFQLLEQDIRGYLAQDVWNEEDNKGDAILVPDELQVVLESEQDRIRNVHTGKSLRSTPSLHQMSDIPVQKGQGIHHTDVRQHMQIDFEQ